MSILTTAMLCQTQLSINNNHSIDFGSIQSQKQYFVYSNEVFRQMLKVKCKPHAYIETLVVDENIEMIQGFDYLVIFTEYSSTFYYYFILDKRMVTEKTSELTLKLDVLQTYMFDYELMSSFIDRCHVPRWNALNLPTDNNVDEGLEFGWTRIIETETLKDIEDNYIICATTPIGSISSTGGGGGGDTGSCNDWRKGYPSNNLIRYLKGYEGFAPRLYKDSGGIPTIGFGTTKADGELFTALVNSQPVTEKQATETMIKSLYTRYGSIIADFVINNFSVDSANRMDSLIDLAYNCGNGAVTTLSNTLPSALAYQPNNESYVRPIWEKYIIRDDHHVIQEGLKLRRKAECNMYFNNTYEKRKIPTIDTNGKIDGSIEGDGYLPSCDIDTNLPTVNNDYGKDWIIPVKGTVSAVYPNYPSGSKHDGIDISCPVGTPVHVSKSGKVIKRRELETSYGKFLFVEHTPNLVTIYAHNSELLVNEGDYVERGQIIAKSGNTGNSTGAHCHWELRVDGVPKNIAPTLKVGEVIK